MKHPELLIPASSLEVLKTAVMFGADAVYIGGKKSDRMHLLFRIRVYL